MTRHHRVTPTWLVLIVATCCSPMDLAAMVRRDRNHPCVVMWSTGNEIREQATPEEHRISRMLTEIVKRHDATRPVTAGCNNQKAGTNGFQETVDVFGYNYKPHLYESFRKAHPDQPLYGSETASTVSSRGEYFFPVSDNKSQGAGEYFQVSSYDLTAPPWANRPQRSESFDPTACRMKPPLTKWPCPPPPGGLGPFRNPCLCRRLG